jgi:hypothetical protein
MGFASLCPSYLLEPDDIKIDEERDNVQPHR